MDLDLALGHALHDSVAATLLGTMLGTHRLGGSLHSSVRASTVLTDGDGLAALGTTFTGRNTAS